MRRIVEGSQRVSHRVHDTQTDIREAHTGNVLRLGHTLTSHDILTILHSVVEVLMNQLDGLELEHIAHGPGTRRDVAFDGVRQGVHTRSGGQTLRHRHHQLAVNHGAHRNVVRVYADHLLLVLLVRDDVVDRHLRSRTGRRRKGKGRNSTVLRGGHTLQRTYILKLGVVVDDTYRLGRINRRATTQGHDTIGTRSLECSQCIQHILDGRIGLDVRENLIGNRCPLQDLLHLGCYAKFHQIFIRDKHHLLIAAFLNLVGNHRAATCSVVGGFVQYNAIHLVCVLRFVD